jgi:AraC family transcriptional regulator of adaptative response/methylated-DNA-[protein]-cysteine methyltransferase
VVFFGVPEAAEREGYRACLRCRPRDPRHGVDSEWTSRICRIIEAHTGEPIRLPALAAQAGMKPSGLQRRFRQTLGISPRSYADAIRLGRLKDRLRQGSDVTTALYDAGYGSSSRLYERARAQMGMTPAIYRQGGRGMEINYTIARSRLGRLLVAGTPRGISAIYLGDGDAPLVAALHKEYPKARIRRNSAGVSRWVRQLVRHLAGRQPQLQMPLDVQATAFQRRVWEALQGIRYGATRSYGEIARTLGQPTAARAVARACATNPVAVLIPCHRVVRNDGTPGGYRWGVRRKDALLAQEKRSGKNRVKVTI